MSHILDGDPMPEPSEGGSSQIEVVRIGQSFKLFSPNRTVVTVPERDSSLYEGIPEFDSSIVLDINGLLPPLPLNINTGAIYKNKSQAFTPFSPSDGYQVTAEDFDGKARVNKKYADPDGGQDIKSSPLALSLQSEREISRVLGILDENYEFTPEALQTLNRLRFQITFPNGLRFESEPQLNRFNTGNLQFFGAFYPVDTRPLAVPGYRKYLMDEGLQIALPAIGEYLQMIDGEFLLAPFPVGMQTDPWE